MPLLDCKVASPMITQHNGCTHFFVFNFSILFLALIVACILCVIYVREDNDSNRLRLHNYICIIWAIWSSLSPPPPPPPPHTHTHTLCWVCDYLSMLGSKLMHIFKRGPCFCLIRRLTDSSTWLCISYGRRHDGISTIATSYRWPSKLSILDNDGIRYTDELLSRLYEKQLYLILTLS